MPNGLLDDASLRTHPEGLALALTLPWYRSLWLSSVSSLRLTVDGKEIRTEDLTLELDGVRYALPDLPAQSETLWYLQEHPLLIAKTESPVALGELHTIQLIGELRLPYMQIAPGQDGGPGMYVPNFVHQTLELTVTDRAAAAPELTTAVTPPPPKAEEDPFSLGAHPVLGKCRIPGRLVRLRRSAEPRGGAGHRPRDRDRGVTGPACLSQRD